MTINTTLIEKYFTTTKINVILYMLIFIVGLNINGYSQIGVTVTNPTNTTPNLQSSYASLASALTDLNAVSAMSGSVTLTLAAGGSETAPTAAGFVLGSATLNPVLSATNTITITKAVGAATVLNASVGTSTPTSATPDGIFSIRGADFITIDGLTFTDGNAANPATMEFGLGLFKTGAGDGANNNTIQNCTFNMQRINNASSTAPMVEGSVGILVINATATTATTSITPTNGGTSATNGTNSGNKFYNNTINGGNYGIVLNGFAASTGVGPTPTATTFLGDLGNDIGGNSSGTGNTISNYGGAASATNPAAGIRANNQWSANISYNTVDNNNGSGVNHPSTLRGIFAQAGTSANVNITFNTVSIKGGGTTSAITAIDNAIGSTAAANTITITNNTVQNCSYSTGTTGTFVAINNSGTAAITNISNNTFQNSTYTGAATSAVVNGIVNSATAIVNINNNTVNNITIGSTGTCLAISVGSPVGAGCSANGNTISNITRTAASGTQRGINMTSPTNNMTFNNNNINNISFTNTTSTGIIDGIYGFSSSTNITINGNTINDLSTPVGNIRPIIEFGSSGTKIVRNNTIFNINTLTGGAGGATFTGITLSTGTVTVTGNKIYGFSSLGGFANAVGINVTGGTGTHLIANNVIGNLQTPSSNNTNAVRGIDLSTTATCNVYYNTIYLNATSSSITTFGTSCFSFSSSPAAVDLRNNILVNLSTPGSESSNNQDNGQSAAIRRSTAGTEGTVPTNYAATSNNNLIWVNPTAGTNNHLSYVEGTGAGTVNRKNTVADFKAFMANRDQASVQENITFLSTTGSNNNFLMPTGATQAESGAAAIVGLTDAFNGAGIRTGYPLSGQVNGGGFAPDMGAFEGDFTPVDLTGPNFANTALANACTPGVRTLTATITDLNGVPTSGAGLPVLYWRINAGAYQSSTAISLGGNQYQFSLGTGSAIYDVIYYYIVAQDNLGNVSVSSTGGSGLTTNPPAAATPPSSPASYINSATLSGIYEVGASGTYTTLSAAVAAYNSACLGGPVTFILRDANYSGAETFPIVINANPTASSTNTLTIKPAVGMSTTITGSSANSIIRLNGADFVTIDGSNTPSGTTKDLTIVNTNTGTSSCVIWIGSASALDGASNNTVKNLNVLGNAPTTTFVGIFSGSGITAGGTAEAPNNNVIIENNTVAKCQYGIAIPGNAAGNTGNVVTKNTVGSNVAGDRIGFIGMFYSNNNGLVVSNNSIFDIYYNAGSNNPMGINIALNVINSSIICNEMRSINYTGTGGYGGKGIQINTGSATSNLTVANNAISDIKGDSWSSGALSDCIWGIRIAGSTGGINLYNNSVNLGSGTFAGNTSGILSGALLIESTVTNVNIRNNIFSTNLVNSAASGAKTYAIYSAEANTAFTALDYNNYFVSGTQGILGYLTTDRVDLAGIQTGFGQNVNSLDLNPLFTGPTNLLPTRTPLDNKGVVIAGISTDITGATRSATTPDVGAYEFLGGSVFPLQFISFNAQKQNNEVALSWQTTNEVNTAYFNVQFGSNGTNWVNIGRVNSFNSNGVNNYGFTHSTPLKGKNFYRLEQMDKDGKFTYSPVRSVDFNVKATSLFVYPNPVKGNRFSVDLGVEVSKPIPYTIYNSIGVALQHGVISNRQQTITTNNLPFGNYLLKLTNGQSVSIIIQ